MSKHLIKINKKQLLLLTTIIPILIWLTIINKLTFFVYCSLSVIGGIITGYLLFKVWLKIQGKNDQTEWWKPTSIFWDELSPTKQQELNQSFKHPQVRYFFHRSGPLSHVIFEPRYLQTLLAKRFLKLHEVQPPIKNLNSFFSSSEKAWFAKRYQCSVNQVYSQKELVSLFNLSSEEENSLVRSKAQELENILQSKITHHD